MRAQADRRRGIATAVSRIDNLEFLADVIPKTTTYKQFKEKKTKEAPGKGAEMEKGQRTLNGNVDYGSASGVNGDIESARPGQTPGHPRPEEKPTISVMINPTQSQDANMVDRTVEGQSTRSGYDHDVEMAG